jgi:hypothetical protein
VSSSRLFYNLEILAINNKFITNYKFFSLIRLSRLDQPDLTLSYIAQKTLHISLRWGYKNYFYHNS